MMRAGKEIDRKERWRRIIDSTYNKWCKTIKGDGILGYLKKGWGKSRWSRMARFRLGNEMREGWYWKEEEKRRCRLCGERLES